MKYKYTAKELKRMGFYRLIQEDFHHPKKFRGFVRQMNSLVNVFEDLAQQFKHKYSKEQSNV